MNRTVIIFYVVLVFGLLGAYAFMVFSPQSTPREIVSQESNSPLEKLQTATVTIPETEETVTLTDGNADLEYGYIQLGNITAQKTTPQGEDIFASFFVNTGGSGTFVHVGLFQEVNGKFELVSSTSLGDRITVESITPGKTNIDGSYDVAIDYLDRTPDQAMADTPTVQAHVVVTISGTSMTPKE